MSAIKRNALRGKHSEPRTALKPLRSQQACREFESGRKFSEVAQAESAEGHCVVRQEFAYEVLQSELCV